MKKIFTVVALMFFIYSNAQTKAQRIVGSFTEISAASGIHVEITQGMEESVFVDSLDDTFTNYIKTEVQNGILKIYFEDNNWEKNKVKNLSLKVFVSYKNLDKLLIGSGATITSTNLITVPSLLIDLNSGSKFTGNLKVTDLALKQNSGAVSKITGTAENVNVDMGSGAVCTSPDFITEICKVIANSGAVLKIGVNQKLYVSIKTGAKVFYKGNPVIEKKKISIGGSLKKI